MLIQTRLHGYYKGRKNIVPIDAYKPEQATHVVDSETPFEAVRAFDRPRIAGTEPCYLDEESRTEFPIWSAYEGLPQGFPAPLFGSQEELGLDASRCYDRQSRLAPYGLDTTIEGGDNEGEPTGSINWKRVNWARAQEQCIARDSNKGKSRTAFIIRTWHTFKYSKHEIVMLRAMISELALATGGQYVIHFLIHVQDDKIPIWASDEVYQKILDESLPEEFRGMGTLWSVAQMKLIYPPPFPATIENFSGGNIYDAYRSLHFPLQFFASQHPEYDYFWEWEMDIRVTGHYYELINQVTQWAEKQPQEYAWERSSKFFIPALHDNSYSKFTGSVIEEVRQSDKQPISGPQRPRELLRPIPEQPTPGNADHTTDFIAFNPLFDPSRTRWAFRNDITGYNDTKPARPPTRAALITASRLSRRLLILMHEETYLNNHTMFPEMYPASTALHYGLKAIAAPLPIYFDREWPIQHASEVFNNAEISPESRAAGMRGIRGHFHGNGSVFGPGEHVFRGGSYYSNAAFASYLWRRWLGHENNNNEIEWESDRGPGKGRMCLPMMVLHPIKED